MLVFSEIMFVQQKNTTAELRGPGQLPADRDQGKKAMPPTWARLVRCHGNRPPTPAGLSIAYWAPEELHEAQTQHPETRTSHRLS